MKYFVSRLAIPWVLLLSSCQMGGQYSDFWEAQNSGLNSQSGAISLATLQSRQAVLSIVLRKGTSHGARDLTTSLQYEEGKGWCLVDDGMKRLVSDKAARSLFQTASQLPCMMSKQFPSSLAIRLSYHDAEKGDLSFFSQDCKEKKAAYLDLLIQMRASMAPTQASELSRSSFQQLMLDKPSLTKMRALYDLSPLMAAIEMGDEQAAAKLMQTAMKTGYILTFVNQSNGYGKTALHYACRAGQGEIVADLLASGASVDLRDDSGATPLMLATRYGHTEIVQQLIAAGAY